MVTENVVESSPRHQDCTKWLHSPGSVHGSYPNILYDTLVVGTTFVPKKSLSSLQRFFTPTLPKINVWTFLEDLFCFVLCRSKRYTALSVKTSLHVLLYEPQSTTLGHTAGPWEDVRTSETISYRHSGPESHRTRSLLVRVFTPWERLSVSRDRM